MNRLRPVTGPVPCLTVFSAVVLLTHVPAFYGLTLAHPAVHVAEHGLFLLAGLLVWWPILDGDPLRSRRLGLWARWSICWPRCFPWRSWARG